MSDELFPYFTTVTTDDVMDLIKKTNRYSDLDFPIEI